MKIALLAPASAIHTVRWANGLVGRGVEVHLLTLHPVRHALDERVSLHELPFGAPLGYFAAARSCRKLMDQIGPDLLNVHYATGYGTLGRLAGFAPTLLSVWGSDVYDFPASSPVHRRLLRANLAIATAIASTSRCMAVKTRETFDHPHIFITPFGVDETVFAPVSKPSAMKNDIVIGTVKTLEHKYGIDTLIRAFGLAREKLGRPDHLKLEITGGGRELSSLEALTDELGLSAAVVFHGPVPHGEVPRMLNRMDIYAALSRLDSESFGVAIIEASACEKPAVVSDADGPAEVVIDNRTGYIVPKEDVGAAADRLITLVRDADLRKRMGEAGRQHVLENYTWNICLDLMIEAYRQTADSEQ